MEQISLWVNQASRSGWVLAELNGVALVEYEMPNGSTSLRLMSRDPDGDRGRTVNRSVSYLGLPLKWLRHLVAEEVGWEGQPQQNAGRSVDQPAELLRQRLEKQEDERNERFGLEAAAFYGKGDN